MRRVRIVERHCHEGCACGRCSRARWLAARRGSDIPGLFYRNVGLRGGPAPVRTYDLQRLLKEVLDGNINPGIVYTSEYTLDDIQEAYAAMDERRTVKSLLRISEV